MKTTIENEVERYQSFILPSTKEYLQGNVLDVGCGNGFTSLILEKELGVHPVLCDIADIRQEEAKKFPFFKIVGPALPFQNKEFDICYIQFVLHHLRTQEDIVSLLREATRVSKRIICIEEVRNERTNIDAALLFDKKMNNLFHPGITMPVYQYLDSQNLHQIFRELGKHLIVDKVLSQGSIENGFLETRLLIAE